MNRPKLPDAELDVMTCLWRLRTATVRDICDALWESRPMTQGSATTLLKRLEAKGLVLRENQKVGRAHVYRAAGSPQTTYRRLLRRLADRVFAGNTTAMVAAMLDARKPTAVELDKLQRLLDDLRAKQKGDPS